MRYGSVCSGIEACSVAVKHLNWTAAWFSEIDPFCNALLSHRYPWVPNHGDITKTKIEDFAAVDVVVGGTPCQSFSVQGNREGMDDPRGKLSLRFCEIVAGCKPAWVVWENVANALSIDGGSAFAAILQGLVRSGYLCAWRILDARYFGVPQRRRRVFIVGHRYSWQRAAAVLFDSRAGREDGSSTRKVSSVRKRTDASTSRVPVTIGWTGDETPKHGVECMPTIRAHQGGEGIGFVSNGRAWKASVTELERLQGFEDGYTEIAGWSDSRRRVAIGNSFCVPAMRWIAERISYVSQGS